MTTGEFSESMALLRKQVGMLTLELGMGAKFDVVSKGFLPKHIKYVYEIRLSYKGYTTKDVFNDTMSFGLTDINKVAVALISSFFRNYLEELSLKVNTGTPNPRSI
tara:strand:+ start:325 stop:642 length:318 start_codon:yes stop_codon:yes gene_type:complete